MKCTQEGNEVETIWKTENDFIFIGGGKTLLPNIDAIKGVKNLPLAFNFHSLVPEAKL